jgi:hypothetical protein
MEAKKTFDCELCTYSTVKPSDWIKHINSAKHQRNGNKKQTKCNICDISFNSHWNYKNHYLVIHDTKEERSKQKYYCTDCDQVFFCSQYMKKHMEGKRHANYILAINLEKELNEKIKLKQIKP